MHKRKHAYITAESEHCLVYFDLSGLNSAVGVTDIYSRQCKPGKECFVSGLLLYQNLQKISPLNPFGREKAGDKAGTCVSVHTAKKAQ